MKNKRLVSILVAVVIAVTTGTIFFWQPDPQVETVQPAPVEQEDEMSPYRAELEAIEELRKTNPRQALEKTEALIESLPEKVQKWVALATEAGIEDINFFGKVIDQNGRPLVGATVHFEAGGKFLGAGGGFGEAMTDAEGRFDITTFGGHLNFWGIRHPQAVFVAHDSPQSDGGHDLVDQPSMLFYNHQPWVGAQKWVWTDYDEKNPYIFDVWRFDKTQAQYNRKKVRQVKMKKSVEPDGRIYTANLNLKRKILKEGENPEGHFTVQCERKPMSHNRDYSDWQVTIRPIAGGIQATKDRYLNSVPESGYSPSYTISSNQQSEDFKPRIRGQRFYFTAQNGQAKGALYVDIAPFNLSYNFNTEEYDSDTCTVRIEFKLNTDGSSNLFYSKS